MASVRNLKQDINNVLGDIIDAVYIVEETQGKQDSEEGAAIIDRAIDTFDTLIAEVNRKDVTDKKAHFKKIRKELEDKAVALVEDINKMA